MSSLQNIASGGDNSERLLTIDRQDNSENENKEVQKRFLGQPEDHLA
jgi:hypothetical protein